MGIAIQVSDLTKVYQRYSHRKQFRTLKSALLRGSLLQELKPDERFLALEGVTFNVREGSTFAVIGRNGSGKSTLLKVIAGISKPSAGTVKVNGPYLRLIELGAGFHPEITGRENVFINGIMLGLTRNARSRSATKKSSPSPSSRTSSRRRSRPTPRGCTCGSASPSPST